MVISPSINQTGSFLSSSPAQPRSTQSCQRSEAKPRPEFAATFPRAVSSALSLCTSSRGWGCFFGGGAAAEGEPASASKAFSKQRTLETSPTARPRKRPTGRRPAEPRKPAASAAEAQRGSRRERSRPGGLVTTLARLLSLAGPPLPFSRLAPPSPRLIGCRGGGARAPGGGWGV